MLFSSWRRPAPEKPAPVEEEYLEFDNFPFKLAVIQELMYEQKLLGEPYRGGDEFMERYAGDLETVSEEMSIQRLLPHIAEAEAYFQELKVPASLADRVEKLYVGEELDISTTRSTPSGATSTSILRTEEPLISPPLRSGNWSSSPA